MNAWHTNYRVSASTSSTLNRLPHQRWPVSQSKQSLLIWLLLAVLAVSRAMGAHAHACTDSTAHCLEEAHAEGMFSAHVDEGCADETCIDTIVEATEGVLAKLVENDSEDLLVGVVVVPFGLLAEQGLAPLLVEAAPHGSPGHWLRPPARAPPVTL